jgi:hypothetical protein
MRLEVKSEELKLVSGKSQRSGKDYSFHTQQAYAHLTGKPYPVEVKLTIDAGNSAYKQGFYDLAPESFYVDKFGNLGLSPKLVAVK